MRKLFSIISNIIFVLLLIAGAFWLIGTFTPESPSGEYKPNEIAELTGFIESRTPAEIFNQTTPYDSGVSIFARWHGFGAPGTNAPESTEVVEL